ncbi:helix-turn-helix domain-containing protein [Prevotella communis]|jgi:hypothetical protein|uniref:helix-turn-helix domain-containing protein n=1 Tax=Prevotella communis TaxID=2913614 RepID=UPI001EDAB1A4|nr:helix-turn-helix domain-containing protein [Prevotella communis]UKK61070.1 helix-turn-helix domain-containing protein [Prevotella communis]UKK63895.1 helix-turn-helix domain-containing protein [Prevotella communis]
MEIELSPKSISLLADALAPRVAVIIMQKMNEDPMKEEWVDTRTAARILGIKPNTLRKNIDKYTHVKSGDKRQGHLLFLRSELINAFAK